MDKSPKPVPVPLPTNDAEDNTPQQLQYVPAIEGVGLYYALGNSNGQPQLYSFDPLLKQWRIAQTNEVERVMVSLGIPNNVIAAMKAFRY